MPKTLTINSTIHNGKYTILKLLSSSDDSAIYTVKNNEDDKTYILKEMVTTINLSPEELESRVEQFNDAMLILTQFDHPNLAKIYEGFSENDCHYAVMERVEGVTLHNLLSMSVKSLPEKQVLQWAVQICDAMQYIQNRPKPFIFDVMDSTHIMIDTDEHIKLINFGLDRFFEGGSFASFASDPKLLSNELKRMADTITFLLTKQGVTEYGLPDGHEMSEPLTKLLNRLLSAGNGGIKDFSQLQKELENILNPPPEKKYQEKNDEPEFRIIDFGRAWQNFVYKVMKQPIWLTGTEIIAIIAVLAFIWIVTHPTVEPRLTAAAYIACGNELVYYDAKTGEQQGKLTLPNPVGKMAACRDGIKLFCSEYPGRRIAVVNAHTNKFIDSISVNNGPEDVVIDTSEDWMYVLHSGDGLVSTVRLAKDTLPDTQSKTKLKNTLEGMYSVGRDAHGLALVKFADDKSKEKAKDELKETNSPSYAVACTSSTNNSLDLFTNPPIESVNSTLCKTAGPIEVSTDGSLIYVGQKGTAQVEIFKSSNLRSQGIISQIGGGDLRKLLLSRDNLYLWCVNGTGSVGIVNLQNKSLLTQVKIEGKPVDAAWNPHSEKPEMWVVSLNPNQLSIVDVNTKTVRQVIKLPGTPSDICFVNAPGLSQ